MAQLKLKSIYGLKTLIGKIYKVTKWQLLLFLTLNY